MSVFVSDTHPLLWFTLDQQRNLSAAALKVFEDATAGRAFIYIPTVVMYEIAILEYRGRIKLNDGFLRWSQTLLRNRGFGLADLDCEIIETAARYSFNADPFDRVVVATAAEFSAHLITRDSAITDADVVEILW